jgi:hypothetical protein
VTNFEGGAQAGTRFSRQAKEQAGSHKDRTLKAVTFSCDL